MGDDLASAIGSSGNRTIGLTNKNYLNVWNSIEQEYVIIHTHGEPDALCGDALYINTSKLANLKKNSKIKCVIITACSTGGGNGSNPNVGQVLSTRIADDGYVICCNTTVATSDERVFCGYYGCTWFVFQNGNCLGVIPGRAISMEAVYRFLFE